MNVIYTAIAGDKDNPLKVSPKFSDYKYVIFTDNINNKDRFLELGWDEVRKLDMFSNDKRYAARRHARIVKVLSTQFFPEADHTLWMDGTHMCKAKPSDLLNKYQNDFLSFKHPVRDCLFDEVEAVRGYNLDWPHLLNKQRDYYIKEGMPRHYCLPATTVLLRKNTPEIQKIELMWWNQICKFSSRDQLSLPYVLWKTGHKNKVAYMKGHWQRNEYVPLTKPHKRP